MNTIKPKLLVAAFALLLLGARPHAPQSSIQRALLKDGVERWHRVKALGEKPWFFQQVEELFNVVLPAKEQLPFGKSVAFLVGVSQYDYLRPQLPFVENDLRDMREFLLNHGSFDTVYVAANKVVTRDLVDDYMSNRFRKSLGSRDRLLFYYSGHGADVGGATGYMQFSAAQADDVVRNVLAINRCMEWSRIIKAGHILFLYDCCASGLAFDAKSGSAEAVQKLIVSLSGEGSRMVITAGTAEEKTYEVKDEAGRGNGVFTRAFLEALASGNADERKTGFATVNEIFAQTERGVKKFAAIYNKKLSPRRWELQETQYRGTFVFVNPALRNLTLAPEYAQALNATPRSPVVREWGTIQLLAFLDGKVYIDGVFKDDIAGGEEKPFDALVGARKVEVRGANETVAQTVTIAKGQTTTLTLKPRQTATLPVVTRSEPTTPQAPAGMVHIKGGTFMMGSDDGESDEKPAHEVDVKDFYLDQYEVTAAKFKQFVDATGYKTDAEKEGWSYAWVGRSWERKDGVTWKHDAEGKLMSSDLMNHPVIHVSWNDAKACANWAKKRLPTEAEWEYAARSGSKGYKYAWGNGNPVGRRGGNIADMALKRPFTNWPRTIWEGYDDGYVFTSPVGSFEPNEFKLYDMTGNVWEWCEDWYGENYYQKRVRDNPQGPAEGTLRVFRGGSWYNYPADVRCTDRGRVTPTSRNYNVGFRCAQDVLF
jgi:formylglycine-generating enzyme required for sulfatase activity